MSAAKAVVAAAIAGLGSLVTALSDNGVTAQEWAIVALSTVTALGVVYGVKNAPAG